VLATIAPFKFAKPISNLPKSVLALPLGGTLNSPFAVIPKSFCNFLIVSLDIVPLNSGFNLLTCV